MWEKKKKEGKAKKYKAKVCVMRKRSKSSEKISERSDGKSETQRILLGVGSQGFNMKLLGRKWIEDGAK